MSTSPTAASRGRKDQAESEVERDYVRLKPEILRTVRGRLAAAATTIDASDLEASYNQAWHALYAELRAGTEVANRKGFLVQLTYRRAIDELRAAGRAGRADLAVEETATDSDLEGLLDDRARIRALIQGLRERLDARELQAATLCYLHGYSRPEAARALGVGRQRMEKIMDRASKETGALVGELRGGEWCESRRSLVGAYALGLLDAEGERRRLAEEHLRDCPACRRRVLCMRGLAAVTPVPALLPALSAGGTTVAGTDAAMKATRPTPAPGGPRPHGSSWSTLKVGAAVATAGIGLAAFGLIALRNEGGTTPQRANPGAAAPSATRPAPATPPPRRATGARRRSVEGAPPPAKAPPPEPAPEPEPVPAPPPEAEPPPPESEPVRDGYSEFELR